MLPDSTLNAQRAQAQPAVFADTGISMLFHAAYSLDAQKKRCKVRLVGGAEIAGAAKIEGSDGIFNVGRRNVLAARAVLWRNGILVNGELVGGTSARTINMAVADGRVAVKCNGKVVAEL
jgi:chemotaxis protein CheD